MNTSNPWIPFYAVSANVTLYLSGGSWSTSSEGCSLRRNAIWGEDRAEELGHYRLVSKNRIQVLTYTGRRYFVPADAVTVHPLTEKTLSSGVSCLRIPNRPVTEWYTEEQLRKVLGL